MLHVLGMAIPTSIPATLLLIGIPILLVCKPWKKFAKRQTKATN